MFSFISKNNYQRQQQQSKCQQNQDFNDFKQQNLKKSYPICSYHFNDCLYRGQMQSYHRKGKGILLHDNGLSGIVRSGTNRLKGHNIFIGNNLILSAIYQQRILEFVFKFSKSILVMTMTKSNGNFNLNSSGYLIEFDFKRVSKLKFKNNVLVQKILFTFEQTKQIIEKLNLQKIIKNQHIQALKLNIYDQQFPYIDIVKKNDFIFNIGYMQRKQVPSKKSPYKFYSTVQRKQQAPKQVQGLGLVIQALYINKSNPFQFQFKILERGFFQNGKLQYFGQQNFANQNFYFGNFKQGKMDGKGLLIYKKQKRFAQGIFQKGKPIKLNEKPFFNFSTEQGLIIYENMRKALHKQDRQIWIDGQIRDIPSTNYFLTKLHQCKNFKRTQDQQIINMQKTYSNFQLSRKVEQFKNPQKIVNYQILQQQILDSNYNILSNSVYKNSNLNMNISSNLKSNTNANQIMNNSILQSKFIEEYKDSLLRQQILLEQLKKSNQRMEQSRRNLNQILNNEETILININSARDSQYMIKSSNNNLQIENPFIRSRLSNRSNQKLENSFNSKSSQKSNSKSRSRQHSRSFSNQRKNNVLNIEDSPIAKINAQNSSRKSFEIKPHLLNLSKQKKQNILQREKQLLKQYQFLQNNNKKNQQQKLRTNSKVGKLVHNNRPTNYNTTSQINNLERNNIYAERLKQMNKKCRLAANQALSLANSNRRKQQKYLQYDHYTHKRKFNYTCQIDNYPSNEGFMRNSIQNIKNRSPLKNNYERTPQKVSKYPKNQQINRTLKKQQVNSLINRLYPHNKTPDYLNGYTYGKAYDSSYYQQRPLGRQAHLKSARDRSKEDVKYGNQYYGKNYQSSILRCNTIPDKY